MDKQRLPIRSLIKEIKNNNYYKQSIEKSRIDSNWRNDTEIEGSVANERLTTHVDPRPQQKTSGKGAVCTHRRKPSANIPYKMSKPHTNISRLSSREMAAGSSQQNNCQTNNNEIVEEDDEECNIGGDAEESSEQYTQFKVQAYPNKAMGCYDRNFRSNTTKSGSSSIGRYKQSEGPAHYGFSTEDDDDNFLTLECDENLYEDDKYHEDSEEEEKVLVHPTRIKQSFVDVHNKNRKNTENKNKETVNDTIADFGFISDDKPIDKKIMVKRDSSGNESKKLKIKKGKKKTNENVDPFCGK